MVQNTLLTSRFAVNRERASGFRRMVAEGLTRAPKWQLRLCSSKRYALAWPLREHKEYQNAVPQTLQLHGHSQLAAFEGL